MLGSIQGWVGYPPAFWRPSQLHPISQAARSPAAFRNRHFASLGCMTGIASRRLLCIPRHVALQGIGEDFHTFGKPSVYAGVSSAATAILPCPCCCYLRPGRAAHRRACLIYLVCSPLTFPLWAGLGDPNSPLLSVSPMTASFSTRRRSKITRTPITMNLSMQRNYRPYFAPASISHFFLLPRPNWASRLSESLHLEDLYPLEFVMCFVTWWSIGIADSSTLTRNFHIQACCLGLLLLLSTHTTGS